jgi:hypothetical protein
MQVYIHFCQPAVQNLYRSLFVFPLANRQPEKNRKHRTRKDKITISILLSIFCMGDSKSAMTKIGKKKSKSNANHIAELQKIAKSQPQQTKANCPEMTKKK